MSFDLDPDARLNRIAARLVVSNIEMKADYEGYVESHMHKKLANLLASTLVRDGGMRKEVGKYSTEYAVDLYCLTSDQLEKYVQRRAERLGYGPPSIRWITGNEQA